MFVATFYRKPIVPSYISVGFIQSLNLCTNVPPSTPPSPPTSPRPNTQTNNFRQNTQRTKPITETPQTTTTPPSPPSPPQPRTPLVSVLGVGGAGGNAVKNMIDHNLQGIRFIVANTDAQALSQSPAEFKVQLGTNLTMGLGAGADPEAGRAAANENLEDVLANVEGSSIAFITAGMGGGTGTGASPVIAESFRKKGLLVIAVVSTPFNFEGKRRRLIAENGVKELESCVDTLMVVPNENLLARASSRLTLIDAFKQADDVLYRGVKGITDLITIPGHVNVDFADIRAIMTNGGRAHMGIGEASGPSRAVDACQIALSNPLLSDCDLHGATGALINVSGNHDLTLLEVDRIVKTIRDQLSPDANIIFGSTFDSQLENSIRITLIVTGLKGHNSKK